MARRKYIWMAIVAVVAVLLAFWVHSRWDAWFTMPPEPEFVFPEMPDNVQFTFGIDAERSRMVTWQSGLAADSAGLALVCPDGDTVRYEAVRHDFQNCSGRGSYYNAQFVVGAGDYRYRVSVDTLASEWYRFSVAPPHSRNALRFIVIGDVQNVQDTLNDVVRKIQRDFSPQFWLQAGDLIERPHMQWWNRYFADFDSVAQSVPVVAALGNHDFHKSLPRKADERFFYTFPFYGLCPDCPEGTAHFDVGDASFYIFNTTRNFFSLMEQRRWFLREVSRGGEGQWRIVMLHHPPFSSKSRFNNLPTKWAFVPAFNAAGVDVVFSAHEHTCERRNPSEGMDFYQFISHFSPKNYTGNPSDGRHFHVVDVTDSFMEVRTYTDMFEMTDSLRIEK